MRAAFTVLASFMLSATASAQQPGVPAPEAAAAAAEPRVNQLIIYGDDTCPESTNEQINVCVKFGEEDRYRIPSNLRDNPDDPASQSWANRAIELSYTGRTGTDSCSTVGAGSFTGCFNQLVQQARAERGASGVDWNQMIEQARRERMQRIDEAEAEEAEAERNVPQN